MSRTVTAEWGRQRRRARERDDHTCQNCGLKGSPTEPDDLQVHHIKAVEDGGSNELDNLVCVCNSCHHQIHRRGPDEDGMYTLEFAREESIDRSDFINTDMPLRPAGKDIIEFMKDRGPTVEKNELDETGYSENHIHKCLKYLRTGGWVERTGWGEYRLVYDGESIVPEVDGSKR